MLIASLVILGGLMLLLGSLVLLVVCSGINDRCDAPPQPSAEAGMSLKRHTPADEGQVIWET
jgi:hypothetical protein